MRNLCRQKGNEESRFDLEYTSNIVEWDLINYFILFTCPHVYDFKCILIGSFSSWNVVFIIENFPKMFVFEIC